MPIAQFGDHVRVECHRQPSRPAANDKPSKPKVLDFVIGSRTVMPGLNSGVVGMKQGERKRLTLQPAEAYGPVQPGLVKEIPRHQFPKHLTLRVGKRLTAKSATTGQRRHVRIVEINPKSVLVDGNHSLAGKVVELEITLISLASSTDANRLPAQRDVKGGSYEPGSVIIPKRKK
jgi:FKBP-type peptidyl-prolyl cis-trans isomerase 2